MSTSEPAPCNKDDSPTHLENDALFMVVSLDKKTCNAEVTGTEKTQDDSNTSLSNIFLEDGANQSNSCEIGSILQDNIGDVEENLFNMMTDSMDPQIIDGVMELDHELDDNVENEEIVGGVELLIEEENRQDNPMIFPENEELQLEENIENEGFQINQAAKGFTKKGIPRKRAAPRKKEEIKTKRQRNKEKHNLQPPCRDACNRNCIKKGARRKEV